MKTLSQTIRGTSLQALVVTLAFVGCELQQDSETGMLAPLDPTPVPIEPITSPEDPRLQDPALGLSIDQINDFFADTSCDAFSNTDGNMSGGAPDFQRGLRGKLTVPPAGSSGSFWYNLDNYTAANGATELQNKLFFSQLNVPTRAFDAGFPMLSGGFLSNAAGQTLYEYFRVDFDGFLELTSSDPEGQYEIAVLSDDGARLKMGLEQTTIINHPLYTATKMHCSTQTVTMAHGTAQPFKLEYFQGPRYHIAVVLMWRPASETAEPLCGQAGNSLFFDSTKTPSAPKAAYNQLLTNGWKPVGQNNFRIPNDELFNPCMSERVRELFGWN